MSALLAAADGSSNGSAVFWVVLAIWVVLVIVGWWKIFEKAGEAGWKALVPIFNLFVLLKIVGRPAWWILLLLIPCVGFVVGIVALNDLSKSFGQGTGFTVGLVLLSPIFALILGFGDARYQGPAGPLGAGRPLPPPAS